MSDADDGSRWVDMVKNVLVDDRVLPITVQKRIKHALQAEILTRSQRPELIEIIDISFPITDGGKPAVRISIKNNELEDNKRFMDNFIAEKTEHYTAEEFLLLKEEGKVNVSWSFPNGYHARCDTTITAESTQSLIEAVGSMITNPTIKAEFLKTSPVAGIS